MQDKTYVVDKYYEMLSTVNGESVAEYTDGFCKDKFAVITDREINEIEPYGVVLIKNI